MIEKLGIFPTAQSEFSKEVARVALILLLPQNTSKQLFFSRSDAFPIYDYWFVWDKIVMTVSFSHSILSLMTLIAEAPTSKGSWFSMTTEAAHPTYKGSIEFMTGLLLLLMVWRSTNFRISCISTYRVTHHSGWRDISHQCFTLWCVIFDTWILTHLLLKSEKGVYTISSN